MDEVKKKEAEQVFTAIYEKNVWGSGSGQGSFLENSRQYIDHLQHILKLYDVKTVLDLGCGDWQFSHQIDWKDIKYLGIDCVPSVIEKNRLKYGTHKIQFTLGDLFDSSLIEGLTTCTFDLVILKDVLAHWNNGQIETYLPLWKERATKLVLICGDQENDEYPVRDVELGGYHPLHPQKFPLCKFPLQVYTSFLADRIKYIYLWEIQNKIPKILFQTSPKKVQHPTIIKQLRKYLTDEWKYLYFNDEDILKYFKDFPLSEFPHIEEVFHSFVKGEHKADLFRYYFLYLNGGVFLDDDAMLVAPLESILKHYSFVSVVGEFPPQVFQGFLGANKGNPAIYRALQHIYQTQQKELSNCYSLFCFKLFEILTKEKWDFSIQLYPHWLNVPRPGVATIYDETNNNSLLLHYYGENQVDEKEFNRPPLVIIQYETRSAIEFQLSMERMAKWTQQQNGIYKRIKKECDRPIFWAKVVFMYEELQSLPYHQGWLIYFDTDIVISPHYESWYQFLEERQVRENQVSFIGGNDPFEFHKIFNAGFFALNLSRKEQALEILYIWLNQYQPDLWTKKDNQWSTHGAWAGEAYEQGTFNELLSSKLAGRDDICMLPQVQAISPNNLTSKHLFTHFAWAHKAHLVPYLNQLKNHNERNKHVMEVLIIQIGDFHHECIGLATEYLIQQHPFQALSIDVYFPERYQHGFAWFEFFQINYRKFIRMYPITQITKKYQIIFYLTAPQSQQFTFSFPHQAFALAHIAEHIIMPREGSQKITHLSLSPLIHGNVTLIPYHFRLFARHYVEDQLPTISYFINSHQSQIHIQEVLRCIGASNRRIIYVNRDQDRISHPNIVNCPNISVSQLISLYVHKTLICFPHSTSWHVKDRISGSYHLSASFQTPTLMSTSLFPIYKRSILQSHYPVTPFGSTYELNQLLTSHSLIGLLIEPQDLATVVDVIENFYTVLQDQRIPLHFYCGKGLKNTWEQRLKQFVSLHIFELPVSTLQVHEKSDLLKDISLWEKLGSYTFVLTLDTRGCLAPQSVWKIQDFFSYDYVGGYAQEKWWWKETEGLHDYNAYQCFNGGISLRKIESCKEVLRTFFPGKTKEFQSKQEFPHFFEDLYFVVGLLHLDKEVALDSHGVQFCSHTQLIPGSFAIYLIDFYHPSSDYIGSVLQYCPTFAKFLAKQQKTYCSRPLDPVSKFTQTFQTVYDKKVWGTEGEGSGPGSDPILAKPYVNFILSYIREHKISSILDIGCGHGTIWLQNSVNFLDYKCTYLGVECAVDPPPNSPSLGLSFLKGDIFDLLHKELKDSVYDLILIKDVLMHWPNMWITLGLTTLRKYGKRILITNNCIPVCPPDMDISIGGFRSLTHESIALLPFQPSLVYKYTADRDKLIYFIQGKVVS